MHSMCITQGVLYNFIKHNYKNPMYTFSTEFSNHVMGSQNAKFNIL